MGSFRADNLFSRYGANAAMKFLFLPLFLTSSTLWAQSPTLPILSLSQEGALQAVQKELDERFSIYGGTIANNVYVTSMSAAYLLVKRIEITGAGISTTSLNVTGTFTVNVTTFVVTSGMTGVRGAPVLYPLEIYGDGDKSNNAISLKDTSQSNAEWRIDQNAGYLRF